MVNSDITTGKIISSSNSQQYWYYFITGRGILEIAIYLRGYIREDIFLLIKNNKIFWEDAEKWTYNIPADIREKLNHELKMLLLKVFW